MLLKQILYVSRCAVPAHPGALRSAIAQILEASLRNNRRDSITGLLGYANGAFIQIIEGPPFEIDELVDRLLMDPRHEGLQILRETRPRGRLFCGWSMAIAPPGAPELSVLDPFSAAPVDLVEALQAAGAAHAAPTERGDRVQASGL